MRSIFYIIFLRNWSFYRFKKKLIFTNWYQEMDKKYLQKSYRVTFLFINLYWILWTCPSLKLPQIKSRMRGGGGNIKSKLTGSSVILGISFLSSFFYCKYQGQFDLHSFQYHKVWSFSSSFFKNNGLGRKYILSKRSM